MRYVKVRIRHTDSFRNKIRKLDKLTIELGKIDKKQKNLSNIVTTVTV